MKWIPVTERLPELSEDEMGSMLSDEVPVLVKELDGWHRAKYAFSYDEYHWRIDGCMGNYNVTHWFELPFLD